MPADTASLSARDRFVAFRRSQPPAPRLTQRTIATRGLDFAVFLSPEVAGATPLLCVNGGLIYDHKLLWPALAPLALKRQLILYDQRGRGATPAPPGARAARIEHDAGDIPALRQALGLARWDVLGHSWGCGIAMLGAERDQTAVRRLVLVDPVGATGDWMPALHPAALGRLTAGERAALQRFDAAVSSDDPAEHSAYSRALYPAWFADPALAAMFSPPRSESATGAAVAGQLRRDGYDWRPLLRALRTPALVVHGDGDLIPVEVARDLVAVLPNARLERIPDSGHMPFWEAPSVFFPIVDAFLAQP